MAQWDNQVNRNGAGELFQLFRDGKARTRAELVTDTGMARTTITSRLEQLLAIGLIAPAGEANSSGGRPPARVAFNPNSGVILAVDLGATHGIVGITNLAGEILLSTRRGQLISDGPEVVLAWVLAAAADLLAQLKLSRDKVIGIGIGVPGPVEHSTGMLTKPPIMPGWDRFDIPAFLQREFSVPVLVDNDVNILALGEHVKVWPTVNDLLFVKVSTGIGCGIIASGELLRGAQGTAGDMGQVQVPYSKDSDRELGDERPLEAIASGPAIAKKLSEQGIPAATSDDVVSLVHAGEPAAIAATRQAGREIGEVLALCVNMFNPAVIVIGGSIARASEQLIAGIREVVYKRSIALATQHLGIVQARGGEMAGVRGAALLVGQRVLSPEHVNELIRRHQA